MENLDIADFIHGCWNDVIISCFACVCVGGGGRGGKLINLTWGKLSHNFIIVLYSEIIKELTFNSNSLLTSREI